MLSGWLTRQAAARAAVVALALGLVILAALAVWAVSVTNATTQQVRVFSDINADWSDIGLQILLEDSLVRQGLDPDPANNQTPPTLPTAEQRAMLSAPLDRIGQLLDGLPRRRPAEAQRVSRFRQEYLGYAEAVQVLRDTRDLPTMISYSSQALSYFGQMRLQILANIADTRQELVVFLDRTDRRGDQLRWITTGVLVVDFLLCALSALSLVGYQRRAEREAASNKHKAMHDTLTGLPNRHLLAERAEAAVIQAARDEQMVGLLLIDLDRFKDINDTLGHQAGDVLLQRVADRLTALSRRGDLVVRLGGDEFAILLTDTDSVEGMAALAERVRRVIQEPVVLSGLTVDFGASIGAAAYPLDSKNSEELLAHADIAMYVAKRGGFGVSVYNPGRDENDPSALTTLSELRRGIERGELILYYQPKVESSSRKACGLEALIRWQHPHRGLLPPGAFLSVIEPTEFIEELTWAVLRMAVEQTAVWMSQGRRLPVSVNITARSLLDDTFPSRVTELLEHFEVPPRLLTLELTETALITAPRLASAALHELRSRGIMVAIDDFGTGYSSMALLRDLPVHELKIDRSFVTTVRTDRRNLAIVTAMIGLANSLDLDVVAEGVEDEETLVALEQMGCPVVQGYHLSRPLPVADVAGWLDHHGYPVVA